MARKRSSRTRSKGRTNSKRRNNRSRKRRAEEARRPRYKEMYEEQLARVAELEAEVARLTARLEALGS